MLSCSTIFSSAGWLCIWGLWALFELRLLQLTHSTWTHAMLEDARNVSVWVWPKTARAHNVDETTCQCPAKLMTGHWLILLDRIWLPLVGFSSIRAVGQTASRNSLLVIIVAGFFNVRRQSDTHVCSECFCMGVTRDCDSTYRRYVTVTGSPAELTDISNVDDLDDGINPSLPTSHLF